MEPALEMIDRSLQGDDTARAFLERTTSFYVLDLSSPDSPKIFGAWNYIHHAINEIERLEATARSTAAAAGPTLADTNKLSFHVRLLTSMALRVARRSPVADQSLIATAIANAAAYVTDNQAQWLTDLNMELREIVMGRIAATAFDFSFHRRSSLHGTSAFADRVAMESLCAILSANAVSGGPASIRQVLTEWIVPSAKNLPAYAVAAVVAHIGAESCRTSAPVGTRDSLQQMSLAIMSLVLIPILVDAIAEDSDGGDDTSQGHRTNTRIAAMCLRAIQMWCDATCLSLPQIKHICAKVDINFTEVLSDALYSDSDQVMDEMAELLEAHLQIPDDLGIAMDRMRQVRYILQVDEISFQQQFNTFQLKVIESNEMSSIISELMPAVGLQRFRFAERTNKGDYHVCRNLTRIACAVSVAWIDGTSAGSAESPESSMVQFLFKAAAHPSNNVCSFALQALTRLVTRFPALAPELLPSLQRRAIRPHHTNEGQIHLDAFDDAEGDFQTFRETVLTDCLGACWIAYGTNYMNSCTCAVEEFCANAESNNHSMQLEAALFCLEAVAPIAQAKDRNFQYNGQLERIHAAVQKKPRSLVDNVLTFEQLCCFTRAYAAWFACPERLETAIGLVVSCLLSSFSQTPPVQIVVDSSGVPYKLSSHQAIVALRDLFSAASQHFSNATETIPALWEACYEAMERGCILTMDDRSAIAKGSCAVIVSLPEEQQTMCLDKMLSMTVARMERLRTNAQQSTGDVKKLAIGFLADEVAVLTCTVSFLAESSLKAEDAMESGCDTSSDPRIPLPDLFLQHVKALWYHFIEPATLWGDHKSMASSISSLTASLIPSTRRNGIVDCDLLRELYALATRLQRKVDCKWGMDFDFVEELLNTHGAMIDVAALKAKEGSALSESEKEVGRIAEESITDVISTSHGCLGNHWTIGSLQKIGQSALESTPVRATSEQNANTALPSVFRLLSIGMAKCPVFLLHQSAQRGRDAQEDGLLHRALIAAGICLTDDNPDLTETAIVFLVSLFQQCSNSHPELNAFLKDSLAQISGGVFESLLIGCCCGKLPKAMMPSTARLLHCMLVANHTANNDADIQAMMERTLRHEMFRLGDPARTTVLALFCQVAAGLVSEALLTEFLEHVWRLHQAEDAAALPSSDDVARFLVMYNS